MSKLMDHGPFRVSDVTSSSDNRCFLQAADALGKLLRKVPKLEQ